MLGRLAGFLYTHRRRVIVISVIGAVIAGVFGSSVAKHMSPYGANDPATQSVQATNRYQKAAGEQIGAGVVALVRSGDVSSTAARQRVTGIARELRSQPDVARVISFYDSHDPAMVSRDHRSTYVLAYFKPLSDTRLKDDAQVVVDHFKGRRDVTLGGAAVANAQVNTQVGHDLERSELLAFPLIFLLSLLFFRSLVAGLLPPLLGGLAIVATFFVLRIVASFVDLSVFALNLVTGLGLGLGDRLQPVHGVALSRGGRRLRIRRHRVAPDAADRRAHDPVQLADDRRGDRVADDLPAAVPVLDGNRRRAGGAAGGRPGAARAAGACWPCSGRA